MKLVGVLVLAMCVYAQALNLNENNEKFPIDGKLEEILNTKHIQLHYARKAESGVDAQSYLGSEAEVDAKMNAARNVVVDAIYSAMDNLRNTIINGNDDVDTFDPLYVNNIGPAELSATSVRLSANFHRISVDGLKWFVVDDVSFNALRLALGFQLTIPRLTISGDYDAEARLLLIRHTAGGAFRIFVNRVEVGLDMRLGTSILSGSLFLRELDIVLDIHDTDISFEGLIGNGWVNGIFNSVLQSISHETIQSELDNVNQVINDALFDVINEFLQNFSLSDITFS